MGQTFKESFGVLRDHFDENPMDPPEHIADVVLPYMYRVLHGRVFVQGPQAVALDRSERLKSFFVAVVDEVDFLFVDETLDTLVDLLFVRPKVKRHIMRRTDAGAFLRYALAITSFVAARLEGFHCAGEVAALRGRLSRDACGILDCVLWIRRSHLQTS